MWRCHSRRSEGSWFLRKVEKYAPNYTAARHRRFDYLTVIISDLSRESRSSTWDCSKLRYTYIPECRHCAGLKKQSLWKYEIRTRNLRSTSQDRYRYVILLCSISKHKMEFTIVCWILIDNLFTNLLAGYHCGRTAPCTGPLFYLTIVVCHFRPLLLRACVRSDEWDTLIFFPACGSTAP